MITSLFRRIVPGHGLEDFVFGMTEMDALRHVSAVDDRWVNEEGDIQIAVDAGQTVLSFHKEENFRLASIEAFSQPRLMLFDKPLFPADCGSVMELLRDAGYASKANIDSDFIDIGCLSMHLFFEGSQLDSVSWGVLFAQDGNRILWPGPKIEN